MSTLERVERQVVAYKWNTNNCSFDPHSFFTLGSIPTPRQNAIRITVTSAVGTMGTMFIHSSFLHAAGCARDSQQACKAAKDNNTHQEDTEDQDAPHPDAGEPRAQEHNLDEDEGEKEA
ncbi:hypothetical protein B0H19DRAFT_1258592 [Mycena capillaripes]|nr:hypothetical protein B0H19DRAFT_1258592 [Mycena capillaripes]